MDPGIDTGIIVVTRGFDSLMREIEKEAGAWLKDSALNPHGVLRG